MSLFEELNKSNKNKPITITVAILSAILGALIGTLFTPFMVRSGLISYPYMGANFPKPSSKVQPLSIKVTTNITEAVDRVKDAVVGVVNLKTLSDPFFSDQEVEKGTGSGIIFEKSNGKAYIVTNYHVIEGYQKVQVNIPNNNKSKTIPARVLGSDPVTDLAVLEISDKEVKTVAEFGNSDTLKAGEPAIAIGNPLGLGQSVTLGVISSPKRSIEVTSKMATDVIQTDAAINPGNSGGALINSAGQVIGINSLKIAESGVEGLGFAIPVNDARPIIDSLIRYGKVARPYLGISVIDLKQLPQHILSYIKAPSNLSSGAVIREIEPQTPAGKAGLRVKDIIVALDNTTIENGSDLRKYIYKNKKIGDRIKITFFRNGKKAETIAILGRAPSP